MTCISDLKCEGVGAPLQLRIIRKWKNDVRRYETCCPELDRHHKVLENDFYIEVGLISVIKSLPDTMTIPKHWFRFVTKSHLMELGEKPPYYLDFIGVLSKIKDCKKANHEPYVFLMLIDKSGNELPINLWNECITFPKKFNRDLLILLPTITVVAVTNLKASTSADKNQYPNSTTICLQDKTFLIKASIMDIQFQDKLYQVLCPTCRDSIHKRGPQCLTVSDATDTISTIISNTSCQKLLKFTLQDLIANNNTVNMKTLLAFLTEQKGQTKNMSIQILKASAGDNLHFIIVDIESSNSTSQTNVPTTPTQVPTTRLTMQESTPDSTMPVTRSACTLSYNTTDDPTPSIDRKRSRKK
ncbi:unnamed protein product [Lactuca saligna]|uniref:Replication factor A C-terminal domain-containing protein n=1 Tax=Lactuca saligna TaxID=75948 RepID=A0AA35YP04_LACSI|nr:unnamed protein product [Lactuca saligna]